MSEQKLCCCRRVQLNPRHRRVGARRAANGDAGNARLRQRLELRVVLRRLNQDRRVKADGIQWICPGGTRISACCFSSAIIADVNATSIINPSRDAPEAIASGTEESKAMVLVLPVRNWRARIFGV